MATEIDFLRDQGKLHIPFFENSFMYCLMSLLTNFFNAWWEHEMCKNLS